MAGSTVSLESLSSPSPSPPPPEEHHSTSNHSGAAGLDSGSELSELTEEEQENDSRDEDSSRRSSTRARKRQRGGIVPAPMWDWAYKQKKADKSDKVDWRTRLIKEEEEEEQSGPAKAMEEEEDEDQDQRSSAAIDDPPQKAPVLSDIEDDPPDDVDDGHESEDDVSPAPAQKKDADEHDSVDEDEDMDEGEPDATPIVQGSPKNRASPDLTDEENGEEEDDVEEDDGPNSAVSRPDEAESEDDDDDAEVGLEDRLEAQRADEPPTELQDAAVDDAFDAADGEENGNGSMEVDTGPPSALLSPVAAAAASKSIMAGSGVIQPPSTPSSASASRASSRSPSPEREAEPEVLSDREPEPEPEPERKRSGARTSRARKGKARTRTSRKSRAAAAADQGADVDADTEQAGAVDGDEGEGADMDDLDVGTPEMEIDADMQPAHRAEALDVLAAIELKFALLRERLYIEKMDVLAWEEALIAEGIHPELLHLHAELSKRRDKRIELASRRNDYETGNVTKRRKLDEEGVWSWWKNARDDLVTDMFSETNRKRRKLERERRVIERPLPNRRFPSIPHDLPPTPTLLEIVKSYPYGVSTPSVHSSRRAKKDHPPVSSLAYPQLTTLSPGDVMRDLEILYQHRRAAAGFDPHRPGMMNAVLGAQPHGMDPYNVGMAVMDGPGIANRFGPPPPSFPHQQPHPHPQIQGPPMIQGFTNPPRLPHHHSAPAGTLPNLAHPQMPMDQDMLQNHRPPSSSAQTMPHMQQFGGPAPGPGNLMRRSISPVPLQMHNSGPGVGMSMMMGGPPVPPGFAGSKANGWGGMGPTGPGAFPGGMKEPKRLNGEADPRDREKERERFQDGLPQRERVQRDFEREREWEQRDADRVFQMQHLQHMQRLNAHQHPHQHMHVAPAQAQHVHIVPHNHQHHHHHVHHRHHPPQPFTGPGGVIPGPPAGNPGMGGGPGGPTLSPHAPRDFEARRPQSGPYPEVMEASSAAKQNIPSPHMSAFWKGNDEQPPASMDLARERGRPLGPPSVGPHERLMTPFTMGPSQVIQGSFPGSPRNAPGPSTAPASVAPSRRGSWSAPDDSGIARPSSSTSLGPGPSTAALRHPGSRAAQSSTAQQLHGPFMSPPQSNGRPLPPPASPSSSLAGPARSPGRSNQFIAPGTQLPPPPLPIPRTPPMRPSSPPKMRSPSSKVSRPPPSPGLAKAPPRVGGVSNMSMDQQFNGSVLTPPASVAPPVAIVTVGTTSPRSLLPASSSPSALPSRIPNGTNSEKPSPHLNSGPVVPKIVPVDGS
ncbi:hypothetical protein A0H81_03169 [Grifola frondosa]|uniref:Sds3-like-domain-containing protein n=1 Tax=Grifola frondosa TaxID=5627 RepID=A0A1C7MNC9_GRIFR|nr:hypothetical protein A0H81_03169 [Grifola frondosa]